MKYKYLPAYLGEETTVNYTKLMRQEYSWFTAENGKMTDLAIVSLKRFRLADLTFTFTLTLTQTQAFTLNIT